MIYKTPLLIAVNNSWMEVNEEDIYDPWDYWLCQDTLLEFVDIPEDVDHIKVVATDKPHEDHVEFEIICSCSARFDDYLDIRLHSDFYHWLKNLPDTHNYLYVELS